MKVLYVLLLGAGPLVVWGQKKAELPPGMMTLFGRGDTLRVMRPDGMVCVVPDRMRVERMPVMQGRSGDKMPNGVRRRQPAERRP